MPALALPKTSYRSASRPGPVHALGPLGRASGPLRVLVVDEKGILREGLCALLSAVPEVDLVGCAPIGADALRIAADLHPDLVILDFPATALNGPRLITGLRAELPEVRVVVLTFHREEEIVEAALRAGAQGYVLKSDTREDLFEAMANVMAGKSFISPALQGRAGHGYASIPDAQKAKSASAR